MQPQDLKRYRFSPPKKFRRIFWLLLGVIVGAAWTTAVALWHILP